jgi:hypothetical protein
MADTEFNRGSLRDSIKAVCKGCGIELSRRERAGAVTANKSVFTARFAIKIICD